MRAFTPLEKSVMREQNFLTGFTLIEVLITVVILSFIVAGIFSVLSVADISWDSFTGALEVQQQARQSMSGMVRELRQSRPSDITITNFGTEITFLIPASVNTINYYLENNQIRRQNPTGNITVLANDISSLSFSRIGFRVEVQIQAAKTIRQKTYSFSLREIVRLRNE